MASKIHKWIEESILIALIAMNIFEVFGLLPGEIGFIKAIISMTGLGYVLFKASLTDIFFGVKHKSIDLFLILSYFMLIINKIVQFSNGLIHESHYWTDFFGAIVQNHIIIETIGYFVGGILLVIISILVAIIVKPQGPSIITTIHGDKTYNIGFVKRLISSFLIIVGFYLVFFNLVMEWLSLVIDAPLIMVALFLYIFKLHELGKKMDSEVILFKVADFVEDFVEKFVNLFHSRRTFLLGISGLLVLHLITDVGVFIIPHSLGTRTLYSEEFGANHETLLTLFNADKVAIEGKFTEFLALMGYVFNSVGLTFLMLFPTYIWYVVYVNHTSESKETMNFPPLVQSTFFACQVYLIFLPTFKIKSIMPGVTDVQNLLGVDIQTQSILSSGFSLVTFSIIAFCVMILFFVLSNIRTIKIILFYLLTFIGIGFFSYYVYTFFVSLLLFNIAGIKVSIDHLGILQGYAFGLQDMLNIFFVFFTGVSLLILIGFYTGGLINYIVSVFKPE